MAEQERGELGQWRGMQFVRAYVIMRLHPSSLRPPATTEEMKVITQVHIAPLRVLWSLEKAQAEADRLNATASSGREHYYVATTKVQASENGGASTTD